MRYDLNDIQTMLNTVLANQQTILRLLRQLQTTENKMAINLDALTAEVQNNTTVDGSIISLLQQVVAQLSNIPPSNDPATQAAIDALVATLSQNDAAIADAVTKNTPAAPAAP